MAPLAFIVRVIDATEFHLFEIEIWATGTGKYGHDPLTTNADRSVETFGRLLPLTTIVWFIAGGITEGAKPDMKATVRGDPTAT